MPAYNAEKTIYIAIKSLLQQTFNDFELIVVDDGSTDNTVSIVVGISDTRIILLTQEHTGVASATNFGISKAQFDIIMRFDSDDIAFPELVERELNLLQQSGKKSIISCRYAFFSNRKILFVVPSKNDSALRKKYLALHCDFPGSSVMFYKHHIAQIGFYQDNLLDDYELWLRAKNISEFILVSEVLILQHWSSTSLSRNNVLKRKKRQYEIQEKYYSDLNAEFGIAEIKEQIRFRAWREFLYGNCKDARKHWMRLGVAFFFYPKLIFSYLLSFLGETVIQQILYLQIKFRLRYIIRYYSDESQRCRSFLFSFLSGVE